MVRCPGCEKTQLVHVVAPARTSCYYCGASWVQTEDEQHNVVALEAPVPRRKGTSGGASLSERGNEMMVMEDPTEDAGSVRTDTRSRILHPSRG
jgi:hypothetical protein